MRQQVRQKAETVAQSLAIGGGPEGNADRIGCRADREGITQNHGQPALARMSAEFSALPWWRQWQPKVMPAGMGMDSEAPQGLPRHGLTMSILVPDGSDDGIEIPIGDPMGGEAAASGEAIMLMARSSAARRTASFVPGTAT